MSTARDFDENTASPRSYRSATLSLIGPAAGSALSAGIIVAWHGTATPLLLSGLLPLLLVLGVIYPAVWSRKPARRKAAFDVLRLLFTGRAPAQRPIPRPRNPKTDTPLPASQAH
jgi:hypothetical protein